MHGADAFPGAQDVANSRGPTEAVATLDNLLTTDQKGAVAELAIATAAAELGIGVWSAFTVERYDLIFDLRPGLVRVQCKWASRRGEVVAVQCHRNRRIKDGLLRQFYSSIDIDAYAACCPDVDKCYFLPIEEFTNRIVVHELLHLKVPNHGPLFRALLRGQLHAESR